MCVMRIVTAAVKIYKQFETTTVTSMLGEIARRSLATAAQLNAELKAAASGDEASREVAIQMLRKKAGTAKTSYAYSLPQNEGGELISALLSIGQYEYKSEFSSTQLAIAATMMAADLINTAGFDPPTVFRNLDSFVKAVSDRGTGFCDPFRMSMAPWFAEVARRNGVGFDKTQLMVYHDGWKLEQDASQDEVKLALMNAAHFQSFLQLVSYKLNAFDIHMAGTRRTMCAGFLVRSFFAFYIQLPQVVIPTLDVTADMIHSLGSMEWDSESEAQEVPEGEYPQLGGEPPKKRAKVEAADKGDKGSKEDAAVLEPENKP